MAKEVKKTTKARGKKAPVKQEKVPEDKPACNRRKKVAKINATAGEGTSTATRRLSSPGEGSCSTAVEDVAAVGKRKAVAGAEGPDGRKRRKVAVKEAEPAAREEVAVGKRKAVTAVEGDGGGKKMRGDLEAPDKKISQKDLRADFKAKYQQQGRLGCGCYGCVYNGYRRTDNLPVAIKRVQKNNILHDDRDVGKTQPPIEVAAMLRLQQGTSSPVGASAPVALLDWYHLGAELIMVHERPDPAKTLQDHITGKGGALKEEEAKIILKQLVEAAVDLQDHHIFHRDIHSANVLVETGSDVPRVRLIDFGSSCFVQEGAPFREFLGNSVHSAPECRRKNYRAEPFTAWQIGAVTYEALHKSAVFLTKPFLRGSMKIDDTLSEECRDFIRVCLTKDPTERATLDRLRVHAWLQ